VVEPENPRDFKGGLPLQNHFQGGYVKECNNYAVMLG